jgi:hypothetical protein
MIGRGRALSDMTEDIRDKPNLDHSDIIGLNFIREPAKYFYRRHYRTGLRSHIMEVLSYESVRNEKQGVVIDGLRRYARAEPLKMLRIFRIKFGTLEDALEELRRVRTIQTYLAPDHIARPEEFLVDYARDGRREVLLCGLQEYVRGEILEPWSRLDRRHLITLVRRMGVEKTGDSDSITNEWIKRVRKKAENFVRKVKHMILEAYFVPDLAGVGNLILTHSGDIKLVDINNISNVSFDPVITLDDRGYPVCDKSIQALSLLERKLLGVSVPGDDRIYKIFLDPKRTGEVKAAEEKFFISVDPNFSYPRPSFQ